MQVLQEIDAMNQPLMGKILFPHWGPEQLSSLANDCSLSLEQCWRQAMKREKGVITPNLENTSSGPRTGPSTFTFVEIRTHPGTKTYVGTQY